MGKKFKILLAASVIGIGSYFTLDSYLDHKYENKDTLKAQTALESLFQDPQQNFTQEYLNSLDQDFWQELNKYDLLELNVLTVKDNTAFYSVQYKNKVTGEIEHNYGSLELNHLK